MSSRDALDDAGIRGLARAITAITAVLGAIACCAGLVAPEARAEPVDRLQLMSAAQRLPTLTDDAGGAPLFSGTDPPLVPQAPISACIVITADGAQGLDRITFAATDVTGDLQRWLTIRTEAGTGGRYGDCTGFNGSVVYQGPLTSLAAVRGDGIDTGWLPAKDPIRTFKITIGVDGSSSALGRTGSTSFTWRLIRGPAPNPTGTSGGQPTTGASGTAFPTASGSPDGSAAQPSGTPRPRGRTPTAGAAQPSGRPSSTDSGDPIASVGIPATGAPAKGTSPWAATSRRLISVLNGVAEQPGFALGPLLVAALFLLTQHLIDMRDPKLAAASRTKRETMLRFPLLYRDSVGDGQALS